MRRRLVASFLAIVALALVAFTVPVGLNLSVLLRDGQRDVALREARTIAVLLATATEADEATARGARLALVQLRDEMEEQTDGRVELIGVDRRPALGRTVVGADDADFDAALAGEERVRSLDASVLGESGLQVTVPATADDGTVDGAVRVTVPTAPVDAQLQGIWLFRLGAGLIVLLLSAIAIAVVTTSLLRPLRLLDAMADRLSRGDLAARADLDQMGPEELRRLAGTLNDAARRIDVLLSAQRAFTADASHQLRTPLTALRLGLENLHDRLDDPEDRAAVDRALRESGRLSRLVSDLLVLARSQASTGSTVAIDVRDALIERGGFWAASAEDVGVRIVVDVPTSGLRILATRGHLEQALDNLIENALRVTPTGASLTLRAAAAASGVVIEVVDEGPGMTPNDRERAFDRFWTATPGGSGLGLAIARELVEHDGGSIVLEETPGGGLTARLRLRRLMPTAAGDHAASMDSR